MTRPDDDGPSAHPGPASDDVRSTEALLADLLVRFEEQGPAALEEACAAHPERAAALRSRLARLEALGLLSPPEGAGTPLAAPPAELGPYRLLRRLGGGGMGVIWLARQRGLDRLVAVKLLRDELLAVPGARERFAREARAAGQLRHPGLVPVHAVGEADGLPYLVMERVDGAPLDRVVAALAERQPSSLTGADLRATVEELVREERALDAEAGGAPSAASSDSGRPPDGELFAGSWERACLGVALQVAEALAHAHGAGVLHRDVKPGNVLLTPAGRVVLVDFGLAAVPGAARLTVTGAPLGSLAYMAPELLGERAVPATAAVDVYGAGLVLLELLGLRAPFVRPSLEHTRQAVLSGRREALRQRNPSVSAATDDLCRVAVELDPARRYADGAALAADLGRVLEGRSLRARPPGALVRGWRTARRHPGAAAAGLLALLLLVGGPLTWALVSSAHARELGDALEQTEAARASADEERAAAVAARAAAERGQVEALEARDAADAARHEAEDQRARAERHLAWAREAVATMLVEVDREELADQPGFDELRREVRERALSFYERFAGELPDDPELAFERLGVLEQLANLLRHLGRPVEAREVFARLATEAGDLSGSEALEFAVRGLTGQAVTLELEGRGAEAGLLHDQVLALRREVLERHPDDRDALWGLARALAARAHRATLDDERLLAASGFAEALVLLEDLLADDPADHDVRVALVRTRHNAGHFLERGGDFAGAREMAERMLAEAEPLLADGDPGQALRLTIALGRHALAAGLAATGEPERAEASWRRALDELESLREQAPHRPDHWWVLGAAHDSLASLLARDGRRAEADVHAGRAHELLAEATRRWPDHAQLGESLAISAANLALGAEARGELARALELLAGAVATLEHLRDLERRPRLDQLLRTVSEIESRVARASGDDERAAAARARLEALDEG